MAAPRMAAPRMSRTTTPLRAEDGNAPMSVGSTVGSVGGGAAATSIADSAAAGSASSLLYSVFSVAMVVGPVVGYLEQWREMHNSRSAEGYAPFVSLILIACNSLRIVYFLGEPFAKMLLWQSVVMLVVQLGLLITVLKLAMSKRILQQASSYNHDHPPQPSMYAQRSQTSVASAVASFLKRCNPLTFTPSELLSRYVVVFGTALLLGVLAFHLSPERAPAVMGYMALGIEATLVIPQIWLNFRRRSTEGLSLLLVFTWCGGDVVKMVFFVVEAQPAPFVVCGSFQLCCDAVVLVQLWWFKDPIRRRGYGVSELTGDETASIRVEGGPGDEDENGTPSGVDTGTERGGLKRGSGPQGSRQWF